MDGISAAKAASSPRPRTAPRNPARCSVCATPPPLARQTRPRPRMGPGLGQPGRHHRPGPEVVCEPGGQVLKRDAPGNLSCPSGQGAALGWAQLNAAQQTVAPRSTMVASTSSGSRFHQSPAEKISTSCKPSNPACATQPRSAADRSRRRPSCRGRSAGRGSAPASRRCGRPAAARGPARSICALSSGSHQT